MKHWTTWPGALAALAAGMGATAVTATAAQIGGSGKTFASDGVRCSASAAGTLEPTIEAGLVNPKRGTNGVVSLDGAFYATLSYARPVTTVVLGDGGNSVVVAVGKKTADRYAYTVAAGQCSTAGNWFSADGTLEYAASGKSYATVTPGCAWNASTGRPQPYVHLFDNGGFLLDVSVNGVPLTQLSALKTHTPVFLSAGWNVISAANASLSTDHFVRNGGDGQCLLPP